MDRLTWLDDAVCRTADPDIWHPGRGGDTTTPRRLCTACPALFECRQWAMQQPHDITGIWGGLTFEDRRQRRRQHRQAA